MHVSEALKEIRNKINDRDEVGMDDDELLSYLNEAIQVISQQMIGQNLPVLAQDMDVDTETATLPENFIKFCGTFPVKITGNTMQLLCDPPVKVRYFASYPIVTIYDNMPFHVAQLNQIAIRQACIYANNQEELDVQQDNALLTEIKGAILNVSQQ